MAEVVRVEHRVLGHGAEVPAVASVEGPTSHHGSCVAVPLLRLADAVFGFAPVEPTAGLDGALTRFGIAHVHDWAGEERRECALTPMGQSRVRTAVGLAEGLWRL